MFIEVAYTGQGILANEYENMDEWVNEWMNKWMNGFDCSIEMLT